jgi:hypothetical protein
LSSQWIQVRGFFRIFVTSLFLWSEKLLAQAGGPPLVGCPRLLIQYIRSFPPYLEGVSSINSPTHTFFLVGRHVILKPRRSIGSDTWMEKE